MPIRTRPGPRGVTRSPRTVRLTINVASMAWRWAQRDGWVKYDPWEHVEVESHSRPEMQRWSSDEMRTWLAVADDDEWAAAWRLLALGMRRGEALALRWADVDLDAPSLTVKRNRVLAGREVVESEPKSLRSRRTLPLGGVPQTVALLRRVRDARTIVPHDSEQGYVVADAAGRPLHPDAVTRRFRALCREAGVPVIRLHDVRHTAGSLMVDEGVPAHDIAAWLGHADTAFTWRTYVHSDESGRLRAGAALAL